MFFNRALVSGLSVDGMIFFISFIIVVASLEKPVLSKTFAYGFYIAGGTLVSV